MVVETVLSMLTLVCHFNQVMHRGWPYFQARVGAGRYGALPYVPFEPGDSLRRPHTSRRRQPMHDAAYGLGYIVLMMA
jgi:hypothetical protein